MGTGGHKSNLVEEFTMYIKVRHVNLRSGWTLSYTQLRNWGLNLANESMLIEKMSELHEKINCGVLTSSFMYYGT